MANQKKRKGRGPGPARKLAAQPAPPVAAAPLPSDVPATLNATEASARLGVAYDTFLLALRDPESEIKAELVPVTSGARSRTQRRWVIPAAELARLSAALSVPVRPLPGKGERRLQRTRPVGLLLTARLIQGALRLAPAAKDADELQTLMVDGLLAEAEAIARGVIGDEQDHAELVREWRAGCGKVGDLVELPLGARGIDPWELLQLEAAAVRAGVPAPNLATALLEQRLLLADEPTQTVEVPVSVLHAARVLTGQAIGTAVPRLLINSVGYMALGHLEEAAYNSPINGSIAAARNYPGGVSDEDEIPF